MFRQNICDKFIKLCETVEIGLGAVQKCVNVVGLEKILQNEELLANFGFGITENEPSKLIVSHPREFDVLIVLVINILT